MSPAGERGGSLARVVVASSRHPGAVMVLVILVTLALGAGVTRLDTNVDVTDVLPRGDPNTLAAKNLTARFKSAFTQQVSITVTVDEGLCLEDNAKLPFRRTPVDCGNVTDEVYIRAMAEMAHFITTQPGSPFRHVIGAHSFYNLINWSIAGGQRAPDKAFALPDTSPEGEARYAAVHEGVWRVIADAITAPMDPSHDMYTNLYLVDPKEELGLREIGDAAIAAREAYIAAVREGRTEWRVFGPQNPPRFFVDIPVANAHSSELVREDFQTLLPLILAFLLVSLFVAFRNVRGMVIAGAALAIAAVWVYGAMGWLDIALNTLNLAVVPLILGVGIDYSIHVITEFQEHKQDGLGNEEAFRVTGRRAGFAMFVATTTTVVGLALLAVSPSVLIGQVGLLSALAMVAVLLLNLTLVPALVVLSGAHAQLGKAFRPSRLMPAVGGGVSRARPLFVLLLLGATLLAAVQAQQLGIEAFGEPGKNFPADDAFRLDHEASIRDFYDLDRGQRERKTNVIVFEGDMTRPEVHHYMDAVQAAMRGRPGLDLNTSRNLPFLIRTWLAIKDGVPSAGLAVLGQRLQPVLAGTPVAEQGPGSYPDSKEELKAEMDAAFRSPLRTFGALFVDAPDYSMSIMTFATETGSFDVAAQAWDEVWGAVGSVESQRPEGVQVAFVGNTATNYLFVQEELPWVAYLGLATLLTVVVLVALFTRSWRATLAVATMNFLTSAWLIGLLPGLGLGLAITLVLPLVFISAVGSDYAVHMAWNIHQVGDPRRVYAVVGKAVVFSALTSVGAFALFTQTQNVPMGRTMLASSVAFALSFVGTVIVLALVYPFPRAERRHPPVLVRAVPREPAAPGPAARSARPGPAPAPSREKA